MSDTLLQRIAAGDADAVRECIDQYSGLVWSLARRFLFDETEAEDAVQEIFVELWKNADRFDPSIAAESTFVAMIARRRLIDRNRRAPKPRPIDPDQAVITDPTPHPEHRTDLSEEAAEAFAALNRLAPDQQRVLRLSILGGLSHDKIATATGLPLGTVKTHARRGLIRLREYLAAHQDQTSPGVSP